MWKDKTKTSGFIVTWSPTSVTSGYTDIVQQFGFNTVTNNPLPETITFDPNEEIIEIGICRDGDGTTRFSDFEGFYFIESNSNQEK